MSAGYGQPSTKKLEDDPQRHGELLEAQRDLLLRVEARLAELVKAGSEANEMLLKMLRAISTRP
ncbi:MAG: hypothetical protein OXQ90_13505 [Gammaproteobacteria bacterium]|nr:hypothetical protein [Gammaproteobacteria bacterium]